jgi:hypothetical protein
MTQQSDGFEAAVENMVATAAAHGYTREQVMAWTRADLVRFLDELNARVQIDQAGLAVVTELAGGTPIWTCCDRCLDDLHGDDQHSPLCPSCCRLHNQSGAYACNHGGHLR